MHSLLFINILTIAQSALLKQSQDLIISTELLEQTISRGINYYLAFAPNLNLGAIQAQATARYLSLQEQGLLPQNTPPDTLSWNKFSNAICANLIRFNLNIPKYNIAKFMRDGRGILTGELELLDLVDNFQPEPQTSDTTLDNIEIYNILYDNAITLQNVIPTVQIFNNQYESIEEITLPDQLYEIGSIVNEDDLIPNSETLNGFEVGFVWMNLYNSLTQIVPLDRLLEAFDECVENLQGTYDYDYRINSTP